MNRFTHTFIAVVVAMAGGFLVSTYAPLSRWPKVAAAALAVGLLMVLMLTLLPRPRHN